MTCRHDWIFAWRDHSHAWVCDRCGAYQTETPDAVIVAVARRGVGVDAMTLPDAMELARLNGELGLAFTEALVEIDRLRATLAATPAPLDRFEHVPSGEPSDVNGLRHCLVCDETWPCEPRQRRDDHDLRHLHDDAESGSASGDPMDATYPGEGGPDDWG